MFGEKKGKKGKEFTGITIEKMNNGYIVGMLDQRTNRAVNLEDSYVFSNEKDTIEFVNKRIGTLKMCDEIEEKDYY